MGFFFKNKKKNKTEETMAQAPEVTTETTTAVSYTHLTLPTIA